MDNAAIEYNMIIIIQPPFYFYDLIGDIVGLTNEIKNEILEESAAFKDISVKLEKKLELEEKEEFPTQVHEWFKEMELYGLGIEEQWGGSGAGCVECALAIEQVAQASASCAILLGAYSLGPGCL